MKAFISYSHKDEHFLERLKVHLAPMKRDEIIEEWSDVEIPAGSALNTSISEALETSQLFIALVSPDYLASTYCHDIEFKRAQEMQAEGLLMIVPIIVEPCDWKKSPFGNLKALPKDGKEVSNWTNENNAFLNIVDELRKLLSEGQSLNDNKSLQSIEQSISTRNYKVKTIFSEVDKVNFKEKSFSEIKKYFEKAAAEINTVDRIQCKTIREDSGTITYLISNRANGQDKYITISTESTHNFSNSDLYYIFEKDIPQNRMQMDQNFEISDDDYDQYWKKVYNSYNRNDETRYTANELAGEIWDNFISQVGIS